MVNLKLRTVDAYTPSLSDDVIPKLENLDADWMHDKIWSPEQLVMHDPP